MLWWVVGVYVGLIEYHQVVIVDEFLKFLSSWFGLRIRFRFPKWSVSVEITGKEYLCSNWDF